jgi:hypothetical protein
VGFPCPYPQLQGYVLKKIQKSVPPQKTIPNSLSRTYYLNICTIF